MVSLYPQYVIVSKIPTIIIMYPVAFCTAAPNLRLFFINEPLSPIYEMIPAKIINGMEVPIANTEGSTAPYEELRTIGIRVKKNNENIVGQNAIEKLTPIRKEPVLPLPFHWGRRELSRLTQLSAKIPIRVNPIRMNNGPINFRNQEKKLGKIS